MNISTISHASLAYTRDPRAMGEVERVVTACCPQYSFGCGYPAGADWVHVLDLLGPDPHHLRRILARASSDATEAVSALLCSYVTALVAVATATYLALPVVPDLAPANLILRFDDHGDVVALSLDERRCLGEGNTEDAALRCALWRLVAVDHIAPLVAVLTQHAPCSAEHLWRVAMTACATVLMRFDGVLMEASRRAA